MKDQIRQSMMACPICRDQHSTLLENPQYSLYRCVSCDHGFIPAPTALKDICTDAYYGSSHKNYFLNPNYSLFKKVHAWIVRWIKNPNFRLLDIGTGKGTFLSYLRKSEKSAELYGIDGAPYQSPDFKYIQGDFMEMDKTNKYDAITSLACIEYVEDINVYVSKMRDLVSTSGMIVIMTQNCRGLMYRVVWLLNKIGLSSGYQRLYSQHRVHFFSNRSLKLLLEKNGFKILSQQNHNCNLAGIDLPTSGRIKTVFYKISLMFVLLISSIFRKGYLQTVVAVNKTAT